MLTFRGSCSLGLCLPNLHPILSLTLLIGRLIASYGNVAASATPWLGPASREKPHEEDGRLTPEQDAPADSDSLAHLLAFLSLQGPRMLFFSLFLLVFHAEFTAVISEKGVLSHSKGTGVFHHFALVCVS